MISAPYTPDQWKRSTRGNLPSSQRPRLKSKALDDAVSPPSQLSAAQRKWWLYFYQFFSQTGQIDAINVPALNLLSIVYSLGYDGLDEGKAVHSAEINSIYVMLCGFGCTPKFRGNYRPLSSNEDL